MINQNQITLKSQANFGMGKLAVRKLDFDIIAGSKGIEKFIIRNNGKTISALRKF
jgi:hypothetical protein